MLKKILIYIVNPRKVILYVMRYGWMNFLSDKTYISLQYRLELKKKLNLKNPKTFNEKLQWLKLYDRKPLYTKLADKVEVRKFIADTIGEQYLVPLLGVWEAFDDIDFDTLPKQFVLKCSHDSHSAVVVSDKSKLNVKKIRKKFKKKLKKNHFWFGREWPYKDMKPRIIAEAYLPGDADGLIDYKFFLCNGILRCLYITRYHRLSGTTRVSFLTPDWERMYISRSDHDEFDELPPQPLRFEEMKKLTASFAGISPFLRVDFYEAEGKIYFSELTFFPTNGTIPFTKPEQDELLGSWIELPDLEN